MGYGEYGYNIPPVDLSGLGDAKKSKKIFSDRGFYRIGEYEKLVVFVKFNLHLLRLVGRRVKFYRVLQKAYQGRIFSFSRRI